VREYILTLLVTAAVTYLATPLVRRIAIRSGAMHEARDRDVHVVPIPLLGGLAMYLGLGAGLFAASQMSPLRGVLIGTNMVQGLLLAGGLIVVVGVIDDRWGMNALSKLAGQVAAGAILVASGCELGWLPLPDGGTFTPDAIQAMVLTILVVVATINAVNFIDGLDGLAAGIVGIAALSFYLYYYWLTHELRLSAEAVPALAAAILAGMCLGFLPHNFYPARIFMGDTGSMLLGLLLAYVPISSITSLDYRTLNGHLNRFPEILPLLLPTAIMVIPYADMLMAVIRRTRAGRSPFAPDRKHLHHRLLDIGHSHRLSVLIMYLWATVFSALVVWFSTVKMPLFVFGVITFAAVLALLVMSMPRLRWWQRGRRRPAVAGGPAAAGPADPAGARMPVTVGAPYGAQHAGRPQPAAAPRPEWPANGQSARPAPAPPSRTESAPPGRAWSAFVRPEPELTVPGALGPELAGPDLTVPDLVAEPAADRRPRSVVGTLPPAASFPRRLPLGAPTRPEAANPDAEADGAAAAPAAAPAGEADRPGGG
jgi:UDP-GlcNAc:undecaprenyl-phosphate/decaprenyl-phosphate GlcNAc-1-phosphate transferase